MKIELAGEQIGLRTGDHGGGDRRDAGCRGRAEFGIEDAVAAVGERQTRAAEVDLEPGAIDRAVVVGAVEVERQMPAFEDADESDDASDPDSESESDVSSESDESEADSSFGGGSSFPFFGSGSSFLEASASVVLVVRADTIVYLNIIEKILPYHSASFLHYRQMGTLPPKLKKLSKLSKPFTF